MNQRLTPSTALLLTVPPLMWAGNAVVGRLVRDDIPPITLNFLRWVLALLILLPLAAWVLRRSSGLWPHWRRFAVLGLLGVGMYNTLQYMALQTSTALNVTLMASSLPLWMLAFGALFAVNSSLHSFLIVSWARADGVSLDVGFYYMSNALGRLIGTILSGWVFQQWGLEACLWVSSLFVLLAAAISAGLPRQEPAHV